MRPTDFNPLLEAIRAVEKEELLQAVLEHGGSFTFPSGEYDLPVKVSFRDGDEVSYGQVLEVRLNGRRDGVIILVNDRECEEYDIPSDLLLPGEAYNIFERMYATGDKVRWNDPAIGDYEDLAEALSRVFDVVDADNPECMLILEEGVPEGCETEVPFHELRHAGAPAALRGTHRFVRAFAESLYAGNVTVIVRDSGNGSSVKGYRMDASNGVTMTIADNGE